VNGAGPTKSGSDLSRAMAKFCNSTTPSPSTSERCAIEMGNATGVDVRLGPRGPDTTRLMTARQFKCSEWPCKIPWAPKCAQTAATTTVYPIRCRTGESSAWPFFGRHQTPLGTIWATRGQRLPRQRPRKQVFVQGDAPPMLPEARTVVFAQRAETAGMPSQPSPPPRGRSARQSRALQRIAIRLPSSEEPPPGGGPPTGKPARRAMREVEKMAKAMLRERHRGAGVSYEERLSGSKSTALSHPRCSWSSLPPRADEAGAIPFRSAGPAPRRARRVAATSRRDMPTTFIPDC